MKRMNSMNFSKYGWISCLLIMALALPALFLTGCDSDDDPIIVDTAPPAVPTGVFSVTGDGVVSVYWNDITLDDLIGYDVYRHDGDDPVYGEYVYLGTVAWDEQLTDDYMFHYFDDFDVVNGETYYYAVLSYDDSGNESDLSYETVIDTPRPEGEGIVLFAESVDATKCGFDFSAANPVAQAANVSTTDIIIELDPVTDILYVKAATLDVMLQDYGTIELVWVDYAPASGYSLAGRSELILGHSYIIRIADGTFANYAKFQVTGITADTVEIDWAYQTALNNRELGVPVGLETDRSSGHVSDIIRF
jgi:hypothetical protein